MPAHGQAPGDRMGGAHARHAARLGSIPSAGAMNDHDDDIGRDDVMESLPFFPALDEDWKQRAACRGMDTSLFFPGQGDAYTVRAAVRVCEGCPVAAECLDYCTASGIRFGIWGGYTERRRRIEIDRRNLKVRYHATHGTNGGYSRHMRDGTEPCDACRAAHNRYGADAKQRRRAAEREDGAA